MTAQANVLRVSHVERCFGSAGVPLQRPGRVLLGEGLLTKVGDWGALGHGGRARAGGRGRTESLVFFVFSRWEGKRTLAPVPDCDHRRPPLHLNHGRPHLPPAAQVCRKSAKPRQFFLFSDLLVYGTVVQERKKVRNAKQHRLYSVTSVAEWMDRLQGVLLGCLQGGHFTPPHRCPAGSLPSTQNSTLSPWTALASSLYRTRPTCSMHGW